MGKCAQDTVLVAGALFSISTCCCFKQLVCHDVNERPTPTCTALAHCCTIFLCHLDLEMYMIDIDIQISISERSSGWATNYVGVDVQ